MGTIGVAKTQVDCNRTPQLLGLADYKVQSLHQLCGPWEIISHRGAQFYHQ